MSEIPQDQSNPLEAKPVAMPVPAVVDSAPAAPAIKPLPELNAAQQVELNFLARESVKMRSGLQHAMALAGEAEHRIAEFIERVFGDEKHKVGGVKFNPALGESAQASIVPQNPEIVAQVEEQRRVHAELMAKQAADLLGVKAPAANDANDRPAVALYFENGAGEKVEATAEDLANPELANAVLFVKQADGTFLEQPKGGAA